jgi:hypothetical protein
MITCQGSQLQTAMGPEPKMMTGLSFPQRGHVIVVII